MYLLRFLSRPMSDSSNRTDRRVSVANGQRETTNTKNEVSLLGCASCGTYFIAEAQIDWAIEKVTQKASVYGDFSDDLRKAMRLCGSCRRKIQNIRNAKTLLEQLSSSVRP